MVKALIAITSYNEPFYDDGAKTGLFVSEALEPFLEFAQKGYDITFASETGTFGYDEHSLSKDFLQGKAREVYEDKDSAYNKTIAQIKKASDLVDTKFDVFFAAGGHGAIFDFPKATDLHKIAAKTWENGNVVSAVCHGPAIFENLNLSNGEPLIKGRKITGFTDIGEEQLGVQDIIKKDNLLTVPQVAKKEGAEYVEPKGPWDNFTVSDGKLITGVNPQSAVETARKIFVAVESVNN
ncbi:glutathione-independent methylglyoxalase [Lodderomyces elongisporus]|uniref:D-lactate dehydratase n=1 Tax=Lodderomyces elongisporus (strain ATCC 11503 / CBS 2605 / JCM 1781 / NBRC 1676 / NRRL YB-4239) TaxID=379508 RepID=A5DXF5_LODEL|nr:glutathione-independent methylglyoxalase [Lodderomyces elongisporus]EDK43863.1 conserved hypothetical protein [Lodderomyces elongisporus NRRL YB-4239]WLF78285.1 glutathione-independent methylglyoxalase [Lodderomyces elongisporus]